MIGEHVEAPDYTEPVVGFRVFELEQLPYGDWMLKSPYEGTRWHSAECSARCSDESWKRHTKRKRYDGPLFPGQPHPGWQQDPDSPLITEGVWVRPHAAPAKRCRCGLYAYFTLPDPYSYGADEKMRLYQADFTTKAPALVVAWGRIETHEDGMRAQHMRVCALGTHRYAEKAVKSVARSLGLATCSHDHLASLAPEYGRLLRPLPTKEKGDIKASAEPEVAVESPTSCGAFRAVLTVLGVGCGTGLLSYVVQEALK